MNGKKITEKEVLIGNRRCILCSNGPSSTVFLWGMFPGVGNDPKILMERVNMIAGDLEFAILGYEVSDWNREFSPWEAEGCMEGQYFTGGGPETLLWITEKVVPYLKMECPDLHLYPVGYSLSGLFSLWSMYESSLFDGAVCASGSLWFDGWDSYMEARNKADKTDQRKDRLVYLSLGGKEDQTKIRKMAGIRTATQKQEAFLRQDPTVRETILQWNKGGHFADSCKRLSSGIAWILKNSKDCERKGRIENESNGFDGGYGWETGSSS